MMKEVENGGGEKPPHFIPVPQSEDDADFDEEEAIVVPMQYHTAVTHDLCGTIGHQCMVAGIVGIVLVVIAVVSVVATKNNRA